MSVSEHGSPIRVGIFAVDEQIEDIPRLNAFNHSQWNVHKRLLAAETQTDLEIFPKTAVNILNEKPIVGHSNGSPCCPSEELHALPMQNGERHLQMLIVTHQGALGVQFAGLDVLQTAEALFR